MAHDVVIGIGSCLLGISLIFFILMFFVYQSWKTGHHLSGPVLKPMGRNLCIIFGILLIISIIMIIYGKLG